MTAYKTHALWIMMWIMTMFLFVGAPEAQAITLTSGHISSVIIDDDDLLTDAEEQEITEFIATTELPQEIHTIGIISFQHATEPFNDYVAGTLRAHHPGFLDTGMNSFQPNTLILAFAMNERLFGIYAGKTVDDTIHATSELDYYLEPMKPLLRAGDVSAAIKSALISTTQPPQQTIIWPWILGFLSIIAAGGAYSARMVRGRMVRSRYAEARAHYTEIVNKLPEINVRAHQLDTPLAQAVVLQDWDTIYESFTQAHTHFQQLPELRHTRDFLTHRATINTMHEQLQKIRVAMDNITTLYLFEQGDVTVRSATLLALDDDITTTLAHTAAAPYQEKLHAISQQVQQLMNNIHAENIVAEYTRLLHNYHQLVTTIATHAFNQKDIQDYSTPRLWNTHWRPGYGYQGYVPFHDLSTWTSAQEAAREQQKNITAAGNTTRFSGGFQGGGGSGKF